MSRNASTRTCSAPCIRRSTGDGKATWLAAAGTAALRCSYRWVWRKLCTADLCRTSHANQRLAPILALLDGVECSLPSYFFLSPTFPAERRRLPTLLLRRFRPSADSLGPSSAMHTAVQNLFFDSPWDLQRGCERRGAFDEAGHAQVLSSNTRDDGKCDSVQ